MLLLFSWLELFLSGSLQAGKSEWTGWSACRTKSRDSKILWIKNYLFTDKDADRLTFFTSPRPRLVFSFFWIFFKCFCFVLFPKTGWIRKLLSFKSLFIMTEKTNALLSKAGVQKLAEIHSLNFQHLRQNVELIYTLKVDRISWTFLLQAPTSAGVYGLTCQHLSSSSLHIVPV